MGPYLYDSHCHLSPYCLAVDGLGSTIDNDSSVCQMALMSTNHFDMELVLQLARSSASSQVIIPCIGVHPWYSHLFAANGTVSHEDHYLGVIKSSESISPSFLQKLPAPVSFPSHMTRMEQQITKLLQDGSRKVVIVGEIGIDKLFRIPWSGFLGNTEARYNKTGDNDKDNENNNSDTKILTTVPPLSPYRVSMDHQLYIFKEQLALAWRTQLPISVHCVKAHGLIYDTIMEFITSNKKHAPTTTIPAICLHSYTGSVDSAKRWVSKKTREKLGKKTKVFFSFSKVLNCPDSDISEQGTGSDISKQIIASDTSKPGTDSDASKPGTNSGSLKNCYSKSETEFIKLVQMLPEDTILIETDLSIDKYYNGTNQSQHSCDLQAVLRQICNIKGWSLDQGTTVLNDNWNKFKGEA
ncbi:putative endodeoxyribonuclease [Saccharomycopsis crataegensis]|uniref:Endodeoxyribonuclease n=1 Tax=Saccharomycopsis crataegensis TaxID=43959 RepID=A0AAV5QEU5_9ASCO|nr:putative endodeoxyribonuclease [Saccharomycopsis crataegensis]